MKKPSLYQLLFAVLVHAAGAQAQADERREFSERNAASRAERAGDAGGRRERLPMEDRLQPRENSTEGRRPGRMTPDERRALRRQIDEAGNELYRRRR